MLYSLGKVDTKGQTNKDAPGVLLKICLLFEHKHRHHFKV